MSLGLNLNDSSVVNSVLRLTDVVMMDNMATGARPQAAPAVVADGPNQCQPPLATKGKAVSWCIHCVDVPHWVGCVLSRWLDSVAHGPLRTPPAPPPTATGAVGGGGAYLNAGGHGATFAINVTCSLTRVIASNNTMLLGEGGAADISIGGYNATLVNATLTISDSSFEENQAGEPSTSLAGTNTLPRWRCFACVSLLLTSWLLNAHCPL